MERRHMSVLAWVFGAPSLVVILCLMTAALWEYRIWVGISLLLLVFVIVGVYLRGLITEQNLRVYRFDHQTETPLDQYGEPRLWRPDMQENLHRYQSAQYMRQSNTL